MGEEGGIRGRGWKQQRKILESLGLMNQKTGRNKGKIANSKVCKAGIYNFGSIIDETIKKKLTKSQKKLDL